MDIEYSLDCIKTWRWFRFLVNLKNPFEQLKMKTNTLLNWSITSAKGNLIFHFLICIIAPILSLSLSNTPTYKLKQTHKTFLFLHSFLSLTLSFSVTLSICPFDFSSYFFIFLRLSLYQISTIFQFLSFYAFISNCYIFGTFIVKFNTQRNKQPKITFFTLFSSSFVTYVSLSFLRTHKYFNTHTHTHTLSLSLSLSLYLTHTNTILYTSSSSNYVCLSSKIG